MVGTAELVLAEATNNIVEHAYVEVDDGTITLSCFKEPGRIGFVIKDRGKNFPNYEIPPPKRTMILTRNPTRFLRAVLVGV